MKTALRWAAVLPFAALAALVAMAGAWLCWKAIDLLPISSGHLDSIAISLLRSAFCPFAFVGAGTQMAPDFHVVVASTLAVFYAGGQLFAFFARHDPSQWLHGIPWIAIGVICSAASIPATMEQLNSD
jgi:hypothetical protein